MKHLRTLSYCWAQSELLHGAISRRCTAFWRMHILLYPSSRASPFQSMSPLLPIPLHLKQKGVLLIHVRSIYMCWLWLCGPCTAWAMYQGLVQCSSGGSHLCRQSML